jgi:predicted esterase
VEHHLDDLLQNRLPRIVEKTGLTIDSLKRSLTLMKRLSLAPARRLVEESSTPIIPDAIVEYDTDGDRYIAYLNDRRLPQLRVNQEYARMSKDKALPVKDRDQLKKWSDDFVIYFSKDIRRTLDYLATRREIDSDKIGFFGVSRGAALSPMVFVAEPRIKVAALWIPGLYLEQIAAEVDAINFAPRVTIPVLQLSGRYDYNFPEDSSSIPFFRALGTPADRKRRVAYDTGHNLPLNEAFRETIDWFDRHLGPPR